MIKGIATSAGISIAKAFKLQQPVLSITDQKADSQQELEAFEHALQSTRNDIKQIQAQAQGKLTQEDLAIFDAHIMVTEDPELISQVQEMITQEAVNAAYAVQQIAQQFISIFEGMDDAYFKERAADIKDVTFRIQAHLCGVTIPNLSLINEPVILVAYDLTPSDTAQLNKNFVRGFATEIGGRTSHSAIMARSLEIPAVVGTGTHTLLDVVNTGDTLILDATQGHVIVNPDEKTREHYERLQKEYESYLASLLALKHEPSVTLDQRHVEIAGNIGTPKDVEGVLSHGGEGIGLYRTEFLYMDSAQMPTEDAQFEAYKKVLESMNGAKVVVRTLDIGGDKELPYLKLPQEMNPFLGYRAIRLCLDQTDIFKTQLRALLRASMYGRLSIMFPMVATIEELRAAKALLEEVKKDLSKLGIPYSDAIEIGIMVEIPAVAVLADVFAKEVDFFSIGTNDLIQYSMAADRMNEQVSYLYQPYNPSILRLLKMIIDGGHEAGIWVGMCGEMAGDLKAIPLLLGLGLDEFSMSAGSILEARSLIRSLNYETMQTMAQKALQCDSAASVLEMMDTYVHS